MAIIYLLILVGLFMTGYYFNHKTPKPPGCEDKEALCNSCKMTSCINHPANQLKGVDKNA